ncbi:hypothetical protein [Lacisediminihabitans changchengi]|uniref:Uncharacterized protein n=1 Tax=Lacisediminihabitans changchengi TaxID=2787634 RepID=A0A934SRS9_9MICO|nr:hypothetical protein [Lacisediminihabitans changchengi]MBK4346949.1 hypothetical protein [Lacisediminihabitans changchengi]MBK4347928.1 hypothetical protein [Lacisediminihabitans changchengi]
MATIGEMFYIVDAGQGRWVIHHQVTGVKAGSLVRTSEGLMLADPESRPIGRYTTFDEALRELYATA